MISAPCKGCTDRYVGCHGSCDKYQNYQQVHQKEKDELDKIHHLERMNRDWIMNAVERNKGK